MKEPLFEPYLRMMRIRKVLPTIRKVRMPRILDIGCGWDARFLKSIEPFVQEAIGIDFKAPDLGNGRIKTLKKVLFDRLPFDDSSFHIVTMLAVLEHIAEPFLLAKEIHRVLIGGGYLVMTVPSRASKPILEFLSYRLGVVSPDEIKDHKKYYNKKDIEKIFVPNGFHVEKHKYFQLGMNNFCIMKTFGK